MNQKDTVNPTTPSNAGNCLLSIVVPVFNETEVVEIFYDRARKFIDSLDGISGQLIFVDDGSKDDTYDKLTRIADADPEVKIIKFSRNFGHQTAITAGVDAAQGDAVAVIDVDLQDPPEVIGKMVEKWQQGYDVIYGIRNKREGESAFKLATANLFYRMLKALTKTDIPVDVGDFRLMSRRAVDQLVQLREKDRFVRGLVSWIGFKQTGVYYNREERLAGETHYPLRKMLHFALDGITSFSNKPLRAATYLGYITSFLGFLYASSVFVQKLLGHTVQGWATIMVGVLCLGGVQLICIGIVGEYIGRIFTEIKQRPLYIVEQVYQQGDEHPSPGQTNTANQATTSRN